MNAEREQRRKDNQEKHRLLQEERYKALAVARAQRKAENRLSYKKKTSAKSYYKAKGSNAETKAKEPNAPIAIEKMLEGVSDDDVNRAAALGCIEENDNVVRRCNLLCCDSDAIKLFCAYSSEEYEIWRIGMCPLAYANREKEWIPPEACDTKQNVVV